MTHFISIMKYIYFPDLDTRAFQCDSLMEQALFYLNGKLDKYFYLIDETQKPTQLSHTFVGSKIYFIYPETNWNPLYPRKKKDGQACFDKLLAGSADSLLETLIDHDRVPILAAVSIALIANGHLEEVLSDYLVRYYMIMFLDLWAGYGDADLELVLKLTFYSPQKIDPSDSVQSSRGQHTKKNLREHINSVTINNVVYYNNLGPYRNISRLELLALQATNEKN